MYLKIYQKLRNPPLCFEPAFVHYLASSQMKSATHQLKAVLFITFSYRFKYPRPPSKILLKCHVSVHTPETSNKRTHISSV